MKAWPRVFIVSVAVKLVLTTGLTTKSILQRHVNDTLKSNPLGFTLQSVSHVSPHTASRQGTIFPISYQVAGESSHKIPLRSKPHLSSLLVNALTRNTPNTSANSTLSSLSVNALTRNTPNTPANSSHRSRRGWQSLFSTVLHNTTFVAKHGEVIASRFSYDDTTNTGFVKDRLREQQMTHISMALTDAGTSDGDSKINKKTGPPTSQHPHGSFRGDTCTGSMTDAGTSDGGSKVNRKTGPPTSQHPHGSFPGDTDSMTDAGTSDGGSKVNRKTGPPTSQHPHGSFRCDTISNPGATQTSWLHIDTKFLMNCLRRQSVVALPSLDGQLVLVLAEQQALKFVNESLSCHMYFTPPAGQVMAMEFEKPLTHFRYENVFSVAESPGNELPQELSRSKVVSGQTFSQQAWDRRAYTFPGQTVWFHVEVNRDLIPILPVVFNFTWVNQSRLPGLEIVFTSPNAGFQLLFSFHDDSEAPRKSSDVRFWNCSSGQWLQYQQHFPCNLKPDCVDGRDEDKCPYSSPECGRGMVAVGHKCCFFIPGDHERGTSWDTATCRQVRGQLVSLNGPEEWRSMELLAAHVDNLMIIGLRTTNDTFPHVYRHTWQHADGTIAYFIGAPSSPRYSSRTCGALEFDSSRRLSLVVVECDSLYNVDVLCERLEGTGRTTSAPEQGVTLAPLESSPSYLSNSAKFVLCPRGHVTHSFLSCDQQSACFEQRSTSCSGVLTPHSPSLPCANGLYNVTFTFVCDFRSDCSDNSDEVFCYYLPCDLNLHFQCWNGQCVKKQAVCNGVKDCQDGSDEDYCVTDSRFSMNQEPWPVVVKLHAFRGVRLEPLNGSYSTNRPLDCPPAHFQCPGSGYCLPVFTRCNGVYDCQGRQDEADCDRYTCPDFYRCRASTVCLTGAEMCDGVFHCPQHDDELLCDSVCPLGCTCYGHAFFCVGPFQAGQFAELRYLHASGSGLRPADVSNNTMLVYLNLASCALRELSHLSLHNLHILHLDDNHLTEVSDEHLSYLPNLRHLSLAGNPLTSIFRKQGVNLAQSTLLHTLDLSRVTIPEFHMTALGPFPNIRVLNLSDCEVGTLSTDRFTTPASLHVLDVRGCPLTYFPRDLLQGLGQLREVMADNYKLCCPANLPSDFNLADCRAPSDEVSSCDNLLRSHIYRVFLALFAALALLGNLTAFVARGILGKVNNGFDIFTVALCVSDFLMGVYLAIIGVTDRLYLGSYLWNDVSWRHSAACKVAGFLCMTSNEVSALVVCLITLDRLLVLCFPFSRVRFSKKSGALASGLVWVVGVVLALIPLLPPTAHWGFYSLNGICMPLPITRNEFPGHSYSFSLLIVFNFVLFMLIAVGQLLIYLSVQKNSLHNSDHDTKRSSKDQRLARRLITVAMSDFLCWFPIGLLGIVSSAGQPVSGEVNVAMAIFVLPLNSAINPFLYTVNRLLEKRQMEKEQRLMELITALQKNRLQ